MPYLTHYAQVSSGQIDLQDFKKDALVVRGRDWKWGNQDGFGKLEINCMYL